MASRATVATVAIFDVPAFRPERKNLLVGEPPQTRLRANLARNVSVALLLILLWKSGRSCRLAVHFYCNPLYTEAIVCRFRAVQIWDCFKFYFCYGFFWILNVILYVFCKFEKKL